MTGGQSQLGLFKELRIIEQLFLLYMYEELKLRLGARSYVVKEKFIRV